MLLRLAEPWWLLALIPAVGAAYWMARRRRSADARLMLPLAAVRARLVVSPWARLEALLPVLRGLALVLFVIALARPQSGERVVSVSTFGVDIVIALDTSNSMQATDFEPNRLEAAKSTADEFIQGRPSDRVGLVTFASLTATRSPLTLDHAMLRERLAEIEPAPRELGTTALGMGLASAVNRLRESQAKSKVVVLLTDGRNTSGAIGPQAAAEAARTFDIRVYTIGVGTRTRQMRQFIGELDEETLQDIAERTDGRYFRADDADSLRRVFETIDELEQTRIESQERELYTDLFAWVLSPAVLLLLLESLLAATRLRRIP